MAGKNPTRSSTQDRRCDRSSAFTRCCQSACLLPPSRPATDAISSRICQPAYTIQPFAFWCRCDLAGRSLGASGQDQRATVQRPFDSLQPRYSATRARGPLEDHRRHSRASGFQHNVPLRPRSHQPAAPDRPACPAMKTAFHSHWRASLQEFLNFKRIGYAYQTQEAALRSFDHFASQHPRMPLPELVRQWLARIPGRQPATVRRDLLIVRQFCLFRRRVDPRSFVPDRIRLAPSALPRFRPYPLSTAQVKMLLRETSHTLRRSPIFRARIRTLLLVLYCTGLRIGEAVHLRLADVDLKRAYFRVGPSKGRIRLVPFRRDLSAELSRWLCLRRRYGFMLTPQTALFEREDGSPDCTQNAARRLTLLFRRCGLKPKRGRQGPRTHDLRHAFCVHRLQRWYRAGLDPGPLLPWLSAYLGHVDLLGTEKYLHATPALLAAASKRFLRSLKFDPAHP